ncbi:MAG: dihydroxyacetone kinase subunit DhaL, partial [Phycicoccus sp.]
MDSETASPSTGRPAPGVDHVDAAGVGRWLTAFAHVVVRDAAELTRLDAAIGDADHGVNMERGVRAVLAALEAAPAAGGDPTQVPGEVLKTAGMTLVSTVGGASGPLYGTFFLRMSASAGSADRLDAAEFAAAVRAGLGGVVQRGKAETGEKTMYDALAPACDALDAAL